MCKVSEYKTVIDSKTRLVKLRKVRTKHTAVGHVCNPMDAATLMEECFALGESAEEFLYMVALNTKCRVLGVFEISHGTVSSTVASPREIFMRAVLCGAVTLIIVHNHPSGSVVPSADDIKTYKTLTQIGELMGIRVNDSVIVAGGCYYSLREDNRGEIRSGGCPYISESTIGYNLNLMEEVQWERLRFYTLVLHRGLQGVSLQ